MNFANNDCNNNHMCFIACSKEEKSVMYVQWSKNVSTGVLSMGLKDLPYSYEQYIVYEEKFDAYVLRHLAQVLASSLKFNV